MKEALQYYNDLNESLCRRWQILKILSVETARSENMLLVKCDI
jgi:hypothetical protein